MTVAELISELEKWPHDWRVEVWEYAMPSTEPAARVVQSVFENNTVLIEG